MSADREQRIRELAHRIWESEGRPSGQQERHWHMAVRLVEAGERQASKPPPGKPARKKRSPSSD